MLLRPQSWPASVCASRQNCLANWRLASSPSKPGPPCCSKSIRPWRRWCSARPASRMWHCPSTSQFRSRSTFHLSSCSSIRWAAGDCPSLRCRARRSLFRQVSIRSGSASYFCSSWGYRPRTHNAWRPPSTGAARSSYRCRPTWVSSAKSRWAMSLACSWKSNAPIPPATGSGS
ncbi:MAG: hypothetical protein MAG451_02933 [Anaerolineales bacterium]|nr:hypothetical protein [Anaerolineales bacterium]